MSESHEEFNLHSIPQSQAEEAAAQLPDGIKEFQILKSFEELEELAVRWGLAPEAPKSLSAEYINEANISKPLGHFTLPASSDAPFSLTALLETAPLFGDPIREWPDDFTILMIFDLPHDLKFAIRYTKTEKVVEYSPSPRSRFEEEFQVAVCDDAERLSWDAENIVPKST